MTTNSFEDEEYFPFDSIFFDDQINRVIDEILPLFNLMIKKYMGFHLLFFSVGIIEVTLIFFFLTYLIHSSLLAASLALVFLTSFSYFILRLYLQTKKAEQFFKLEHQYRTACQKLMEFRDEIPEHHLALANACTKFATLLQGREHAYYAPPHWMEFLAPTMERFSLWWHWHDIHHMRELLLLSSVEAHITLVKFEPTNLEVHAALANAYVMLSGLYVNPHHAESYDEDRWMPSESALKMLEDKFRVTAERAIEEFKILNDYAPDDPWVHMQLAYSYRDLGMPEEEIREYETVLRLCPNDKDTFFKLGLLYFQQGQNAKGLEIYEELKSSYYKKAAQLIEHYGDYKHSSL